MIEVEVDDEGLPNDFDGGESGRFSLLLDVLTRMRGEMSDKHKGKTQQQNDEI